MVKSEQINELAAALAKAQKEIQGAIADSTNPFFNSSYADLASVWKAIRDPFSKNGLSVVQTTKETDRGSYIETVLLHSSGQWIMGELKIRTNKEDPQGIVAGMTYARRATLSAMSGVAQIDDDGNMASGNSLEKKGKPMSLVTPPPALKVKPYEPPPFGDPSNEADPFEPIESTQPTISPLDKKVMVGKHSGKSFSELISHHIDYVKWASSAERPSPILKELVAYAKFHGALT